MINKSSVIVACLSASMLSACQTAPQTRVENPVETQAKDSDLVMMPGRASANKANSSFQLTAMTLDELRGCAQNLYDIKTANTALKVKNAVIEKRKATLNETEKSLIERRLNIDTHNVKLVKEFNQEGNKYMESVKQLQVDINDYNTQVNKSNQETNAYSAKCNNRAYKASDLSQLAPNLIDVMQSNSEMLDVPIFDNSSAGSETTNTQGGGNSSTIHLPGTNRK